MQITLITGKPRPEVTWWYGGHYLQDQTELAGERNTKVVQLNNLTEQGQIITCRANNSDLVEDLSTSVTIDLSCK